jgi:hypothetical protein
MALVPYGPPIHDAIASGDLAKMKSLANETEEVLRQHGDAPTSLELLKVEIAKREATPLTGSGVHALSPYGPPIHPAIARGDLQEMKRLAAEAEAYVAKTGDVSAALTMLKAEISKAETNKK